MAKQAAMIATVIRVPKAEMSRFHGKTWAESLALAETMESVTVHGGVDVRGVHPNNCPPDHAVLREIDNGATGLLFQNW